MTSHRPQTSSPWRSWTGRRSTRPATPHSTRKSHNMGCGDRGDRFIVPDDRDHREGYTTLWGTTCTARMRRAAPALRGSATNEGSTAGDASSDVTLSGQYSFGSSRVRRNSRGRCKSQTKPALSCRLASSRRFHSIRRPGTPQTVPSDCRRGRTCSIAESRVAPPFHSIHAEFAECA